MTRRYLGDNQLVRLALTGFVRSARQHRDDNRHNGDRLRWSVLPFHDVSFQVFNRRVVGSRRVSFWLSNGGPDASWVRAIETFEDLALDVPTYLIFKMIDAFAAEDPLNDHVWFGETDETDEAFSLALDRFRQLVVRFAPRRGLALPNLDEWPEMPRLEGSLSDDPAHIGLRAQIERDAALLKKHSLASVSPNTSTGSSDSASLDPPLT